MTQPPTYGFFGGSDVAPRPAVPVATPAPAPAPAAPPAPVAPPQPVPAPAVVSDLSDVVVTAPAARAYGRTPTLDDMLRWVVEHGASDLHLRSGQPPRARVHGELTTIDQMPVLSEPVLRAMFDQIMNDRQRALFATHHDADMAYALGDHARFRVNLFDAQRQPGAVLRLIPTDVRTVDDLEVPESLRELTRRSRGLVLVTGPTGSGKSTLLASLVDLVNRTRSAHIVTIEDPVEFTHRTRKSLVTQREVGDDTDSFASALRAVLRQDPDVILLGEMRDLETTQAAIEAAETGHLVFATMHTKSAPETISRIVNMFPSGVQNQIQATLSSALAAVCSQVLVRASGGKGRHAAREIMIVDDPVRALIRKGQLEQIRNTMLSSRDSGMQTLDDDLARLVRTGQADRPDAEMWVSDRDEYLRRLSSI